MDYFVKKTWIRIAVCVVLVAVAVLAMTGVFGGSGELFYDPASANGSAISSAEAAEQGFGGEVTVHASVENNTIRELTIDTPDETEGLGKRASDAEFTEQFIGKTGPFTFGEDGIEALSGATVTSNAALKAINRVVTGEDAAPAEEPAAEEKTETAEEPAEAADTKQAETADAVQSITEQGFGGDVTIHAELNEDGSVKSLTIDTPDETAGLGQRASEAAFTDQFIGKSGPFTYGEDGIEALSGATVTSNAALKAINKAVSGGQAAEEPAAETEERPAEEKAEEPAAKPEEKTETASDGQAYGVYRSTKENTFSKVTVTASAKNGKLTDVQITSEGEEGKDLLTDEIRKEWAKAILESGSASPDVITGATLTFSAGSVQEAMTEILAKMNNGDAEPAAEPAAETEEKPAEEKPAEEKPEEPAATPEEKSEPASDGQAYGVYRSTKENTFSRITVTASAKNGKLTDVQITSEGEEGKDLLTDEIRNEWAKAILESGSASPDTITGATLTFSAGSVQEAMTEILDKMNGTVTAETAPATEETPADEGTPSAEAPAEEPAEGTSEKTSEKTGDILSAIVISMGRESENSYVTDYLEQDPYLVNIYEGYGFAKDYGSARGHAYTLEDVQKTQRPHAKANCLTCKTPDMHKMIEEQGVSVYSMPFDEVMAQTTNTISCYTCHGADDGNGGQMVVTHQYVNEALGENAGEINAASLSCGQCHIEYYFTAEDSEAMMPYHSKAEMTPEAILAYYDELGFSDWEQPGTGTKMLKAQHPELETYSYGKHAAMLSCADCHMPVETTDSGDQYHNHHLVSPLENETLLAKCAACHGSAENTTALVKGIQEKVTARETEVGNRLSGLKDALTDAVSAGNMSEEELDAVRKLHREAQWFFDFCYVENSEGAHNSTLAMNCLNTSDEKITEALGLLAASGGQTAEEPAAVTEEKPAEENPAEEKTEETASDGQAYGVYRSTKENTFSKVTVTASAKNGKLTDVQITSEGEEGKDLLTDTIREEWAKAILESGSASPDAITGATLTFSAGSVQEAMTEILAKMNGGNAEPATEPAAEPDEAPAEETKEESAAEPEQEPAAEQAAEPAPETMKTSGTEEPAKAPPAYAGYRAESENSFSIITVIAYARNGKLTAVKILSDGAEGDDLMTDEIKAEWAKAILESGSAAPDAITGATLKYSATCVTEAMTEILDKMNGK